MNSTTEKGFIQTESNVFAENRMLKLGFFVLVIVTIWNGYAVHNLQDNMRTTVLPPFTDKEWVLTGNDANDEYLADIGLHTVQLVGTWTPGSVREQLNQVLKLIHPDSYPKYRDQFKQISDRAQKYASVSFAVQWDPGQAIERRENTITIRAVRRRITGDQISRTEPVDYVIHFSIEAGRFWIRDISDSVGGRDAESEA